jgi:hypothetical protein
MERLSNLLHYRGVGTNSYLSRTSVSHKEPQTEVATKRHKKHKIIPA